MNTADTTEQTASLPARAAHNGTALIPDEIDRMVARVALHQKNLGETDKAFVNRYKAELLTVDSWVRTLRNREPGRLTDRTREKWASRLRRLVARIDGLDTGEAIYETLPILRYAVSLFERLRGVTTDRHVGWLIGTPGTGKSVSLRHLRRLSPADTAFANVNKNWCDNRTAINTGIAEALCVTIEKNASLTWRRIIEHLQASPTTLLLDEFHEGGVLLMKTIKSLVNEAPNARVIVATIPTAYNALLAGRNDAMLEAQQLLERTLSPLRKDWENGLRDEDIDAWLASGAPEFDAGTRRDLVNAFRDRPRKGGSLRCIADVIETARGAADAADRDLSPADVTAALTLLTKGAR
jgi:hypothetical protein